jgi:hypothetical protein
MNRLTARSLAVFNRWFIDYRLIREDILDALLWVVRRCANQCIVDPEGRGSQSFV